MHKLIVPILSCLVLLSACGPRTEPYRTAERPDEKGFGSAVPAGHTAYDNASLASLFVRLTHGLESGNYRRGLQRFEAPVRVGMTGPGAPAYEAFLGRFLAEIRKETGIDIRRGKGPHNLLIRFVPGEEFLRDNTNQCMVVFGRPTWKQLQDNPRRYSGGITRTITRQTMMTVIIPDTVEPYRVRECLLEEITQALGPANDLFGLGPTIFNDDNAHSWPTRLDYLMLRVLYDPSLKSGLDQRATARLALAVLDRINPTGRKAPPLPPIPQARFVRWRLAMHTQAMMKDKVRSFILANRLARRAHALAPDTNYDCAGATFVAGTARRVRAENRDALVEEAIDLCTRVHGKDDIRIALLRLQRAYGHLDAKRYRKAMADAKAIIPVFRAHALDGSLASAYIVRTSAGYRLNDPKWESEYLPKAAKWSAYAFGDDHEVTRRLRP